jgi:carboxypeptidase family protein
MIYMNPLRKAGWGVFRVFLMGLLFLANSHFASAQVSASITGRIEDASGAAIPEAAVAVTSQETGVTRTVTADAAGNYRVLSLPVGRYEVKAEKAGFKAAVQAGINLVVGQQAVLNLKLEVGEVQQQVTVTGEVPLVNTTTASVSGLVGEREVKELPLNGRSFDMLITLNAGASNFTAMKVTQGTGAGLGNIFSVSGRHFFENMFLLNGVEYTGPSQTHSVPGGVSGQLLGIDAVREFNVVSDTYGAEYGKRAGAQVSVVTQSGTNSLHGSLFEFLRNSKLDARNFFDQGSIPPFKRNQFGGALGGPIRKDKTFIFGNYEGFRQRLGLSSVTVVPDENARKGLLPNAQGVPTPVAGLNPGMLPYMAFWPEPNGPNLGGGIALAFSNPAQSIREDFGTVRGDHSFSEKDQLATVYTLDDGDSVTPLPDPLFGTVINLRSQVLSLQETHLFSPSVINTFTAGFSRAAFYFYTPPLVSLPSNLSFVEGQIPGRIGVSGGGSGTGTTLTLAGSAASGLFVPRRSVFTYQDGIQVVKGKHQISGGVWFQWLRSNELGVSGQTGLATFASLPTFLQGTTSNFEVAPTSVPHSWRQLEGAWYLQDNIQVSPNLSVRVGLRHEFTNGWNDATNTASNFPLDPNGVPLTNPVMGHSVYTENNSKWLFGPRVGIAWDPFGKGKTSIRAGFGTHFDFQDTLGFLLNNVPPLNGSFVFQNVPFLPLLPIRPSVPTPPVCGPGIPAPCTTYSPQGIQANSKTPTVEEWNFTVEQGITPNTSLRLSYVGSHGYHSLIYADPNAVRAQICANAAGCTSGGVGSARGTVAQGAEYIPVGTRPNPYLSSGRFWFSEGISSYNALLVELTKRFSSGLQFRANYTWSKTLDDSSGLGGAAGATQQVYVLLDPQNPKRDWGRAGEDMRHKFVFSGGYQLPFGQNKPFLSGLTGAGAKLVSGWQVNWIVTALSGYPFTPIVGANRSGNGDSRSPDRPSVNPAFSGPVIRGNPNQWFNPNAFLLPVAGTWGNLGRDPLTAPGLGELDLSLFKTTAITERISLQFRAETFNLLNRANFGNPSLGVFTGTAVNPSAGLITTTTTTSRQIQFGLKLMF